MESQLGAELLGLAEKFPSGFVVRLHVLGDFYSKEYVMAWAKWLRTFRQIHVFGYTARLHAEEIGKALDAVWAEFPERWWIRFSHQDDVDWLSTGDSGIVCPVQTGRVGCCGECALCWAAKKPIKFLVH